MQDARLVGQGARASWYGRQCGKVLGFRAQFHRPVSAVGFTRMNVDGALAFRDDSANMGELFSASSVDV